MTAYWAAVSLIQATDVIRTLQRAGRQVTDSDVQGLRQLQENYVAAREGRPANSLTARWGAGRTSH